MKSTRYLKDGTRCDVGYYGAEGFEIVVGNWSVFQNPHMSLQTARQYLWALADSTLLKYACLRRCANDEMPREMPTDSWTVREEKRRRIDDERRRIGTAFERAAVRAQKGVAR